jgi:glycosyltransferase involved in cell wall biosynthesis
MKRRITYLLPEFVDHPIGGYKVHYQYANELARQGNHVTVLHPAARRGRLTFLEHTRCIKLALQQRTTGRRPITWFNFDPSVDVRIVHRLTGRTLPPADITILTAWQTADRTIDPAPGAGVMVQIVYDYEFWMEHPESRNRIRAALSRDDVTYIATSGVVARMLKSLGSEVFAVVTAGLDVGEFAIDEPIEERQNVVAFPLRSGTSKDMTTAFRAAEMIHSALPNVTIQCFGGSQAHGIPACVQVLGQLDQWSLRALYNRSSVFMLTSKYEGWGLPAAEAMACGAAVVSTRNGGTEDFLTDGRNGLLVPVADPSALAGAVISLLNNPADRVRLATAGANESVSRTVATSARHLGEVLSEIVTDTTTR